MIKYVIVRQIGRSDGDIRQKKRQEKCDKDILKIE